MRFPSLPFFSAENGEYWRILTPGIHIVTASAPGFTSATKKIHLPPHMHTAGRVDFALKKTSPESDVQERGNAFAASGTYEQFDPYNQYRHYNQIVDFSQNQEERGEKPWWWNYFVLSGNTAPTWLLKHYQSVN